MKNTVSLILRIAMLLCVAAAAILALNQALVPDLIVLIAAILFFILSMVFYGQVREKPAAPVRQYDRNAKYMRLCPRCGFIGSQRSGESVPHCPKCGSSLIATDTTITEYTAMTEKQRTAWKRRWL